MTGRVVVSLAIPAAMERSIDKITFFATDARRAACLHGLMAARRVRLGVWRVAHD